MEEPIQTLATRKDRGAFFTPPAIAEFLVDWAIGNNESATVLDPSCGDGVFLHAAGKRLVGLGRSTSDLDQLVFGVDIHGESLDDAMRTLGEDDLDAHLIARDFFDLPTPDQSGSPIPRMAAVVGNPPFVRYQKHTGETRRLAAKAALRQGVRLSGLASSWAPLVVHASSFLNPDGKLAMVLPAELFTVHYAEPIRRWLLDRFEAVSVVVFEALQFSDALENVVLLLARGSGGCDAFSVYFVNDADDLRNIRPFDELAVTPADEGKWTDLFLAGSQRSLFRGVVEDSFNGLETYGTVGLGTVTGANAFFALTEHTRRAYGLDESQLLPISPPGTKHLKGIKFGLADWKRLREEGERVWLLRPDPHDASPGLMAYVQHGEAIGVDEAYKCRIRDPWWRPPAVDPPDLFFTYMSHRFPRIIANTAKATFLNSMHGVWLANPGRQWIGSALSLLSLNSVTMLGAEVYGRSYGGGILKMEPREAASLPVPSVVQLREAWEQIKPDRDRLDRELRRGQWTTVLARVDQVLLRDTLGLSVSDADVLHGAARSLRERRLGRKLPKRE